MKFMMPFAALSLTIAAPAWAEDKPSRDGKAHAAEPLMAQLVDIRKRGSSAMRANEAALLRRLLFADGRLDAYEEDLVRELTYEELRAIAIAPIGQEDPYDPAGWYVMFGTLNGPALRELDGLIDADYFAIWQKGDRAAALAELARSGLASPEQGQKVQRFLFARAAEALAASSKDNFWQPARDLIKHATEAYETLEGSARLDARDQMYWALEEAKEATGADLPHFVYSYLKRPG